eukprot:gene14608-16119_t
MELERRDFRAMIHYDFKKGMKQEECHTQLFQTFEDIAPSRATVFRWFAEFKRGRESLKDEAHPGRPPTAVVPETVAADSLKIGSAAVHIILHEKLQVRKVTARWVPHCLTDQQKDHQVNWCQFMLQKFEEGKSKRVYDIVTGDESWIYQFDPETKRQSSVWIFPGENPAQKFWRSRSVGKKMVASFFSKTGHVATIKLEDRPTVNADWYVNHCIPQVLDAWRNKRPRTGLRGLLWHHDNASPHTAALTIDFLSENSIQLVTHPAYSPDLAPCDFFLFPTVKEKIRGTRFDSCDDAICACKEAVSDLTKEQWAHCFDMWFY